MTDGTPCPSCGHPLGSADQSCTFCGTPVPGAEAPPGGPDPAAPAAAPTPWDVILVKLRDATRGRFEIERELGEGGMAAVHLAHDVALARKVAIKVMSPMSPIPMADPSWKLNSRTLGSSAGPPKLYTEPEPKGTICASLRPLMEVHTSGTAMPMSSVFVSP